MLKRNIGVNLEFCCKSHDISKETMDYIKEFPNSEYINIGLEEILKFMRKETQNAMNSSEELRAQIERRQNINNFQIKLNNNYSIKVREKLPEKIRPNKEGIKNNEYNIYEKFQANNNVLKMYEEDGKMSLFLNNIYRILKEVMDKTWEGNTSIKISKYKNYDHCMKNIITLCGEKEFDFKINFLDEEQFPLNFLKKIIIDSKIDKIDVINKMAMKTLDYVFIAAKMNNSFLLCIYILILKGWSKLNIDVNNQITKRIFEFDFDVDIFTLFKYELHLLLFKQKLINIELYQNYMLDLLNQSSVVNRTVQHLLKTLLSSSNSSNHDYSKNSFKKMNVFISNSKSYNNYYLLFNQKASIFIDNAMNYNSLYKSENNQNNNLISAENDNSDAKDKKELNNLYLLFFKKIIELGYNLIFQKNQKFFGENKIENMFSENDILKCIHHICDICLNNTFDSKFKKYSYFFYPEKLSIFIYYLINYKNVSLMPILDIIIQFFHSYYVTSQRNFNQKKYHKFFINLINLIANPPNINENIITQNNSINHLILICDTLKVLSPKNYPGFTLAWLDLISYHNFINNFLDTVLIEQNSYKYEKYLSLLIDILSYLNQIKSQIIKHYYYKFILDEIYKFFYLLVNTYPCFIASYYYLLISCLSLSMNPEDEETNVFIQIKNIILSSPITDKNFFNHNFLNRKLLKDNFIPNKIIYLITNSLEEEEVQNADDLQLKILVNKYFNEKRDENTLEEILEIFDNIKDEKELNYVYNGLAIYVTQYQIMKKNNNNFNKKIIYNFYLFLLCNLNEVHKKHLIDSILNLMQFNCPPTIEFSSLFQDLLLNIGNEDIEKQLIFNFRERIYGFPIPWGIKYTYDLLLKNEKYEKNVFKG